MQSITCDIHRGTPLGACQVPAGITLSPNLKAIYTIIRKLGLAIILFINDCS